MGKLIGWSVVFGMWGSLLITGEYHAKKATEHNMKIQEQSYSNKFIEDTAEDMIEWIVEDVANGYVDSVYADTYVDNLEGIIKEIRK